MSPTFSASVTKISAENNISNALCIIGVMDPMVVNMLLSHTFVWLTAAYEVPSYVPCAELK